MSTFVLPGHVSLNTGQDHEHDTEHAEASGPASSAHRRSRRRGDRAVSRRQPDVRQGHALEILGHAVEYLVDSRMFMAGTLPQAADQYALQILMHSSRAVFAECAEITPLWTRIARWAAAHLRSSVADDPAAKHW